MSNRSPIVSYLDACVSRLRKKFGKLCGIHAEELEVGSFLMEITMEALDMRMYMAVQLPSQVVCRITAWSTDYLRKFPAMDWVLMVSQGPSACRVKSP